MKRLCVDARLWNATGIGTVLKNLLPRFLKAEDLTVTLLCCPSDQKELSEKGFSRLIPLKSSIYSLREQWEIPLKTPRCDLFWIPHFNVSFVPVRTKRLLVTLHDTFHLTHASEFSWVERKYARFFYRRAVMRADWVTTISQFSLQEILRHCAPFSSPLEAIFLGISSHFTPCMDKKKKEEVQKKYALPARFLLAVGNFKPHKNLPRLLEAFQDLDSSLSLVLVGKKKPVRKERVHCVPYVDQEDLPAIYSLAEALLFPSLYEGFGFPPLEAMACGCPAIVSHVASIPEACGEAAEYVDPYSVSSIVAGIKRVVDSPTRRDMLIQRGLEQVKKYDWDVCAQRYLSLMRNLY